MSDTRDSRYGGMGDDRPADDGLAEGPIDFSAVQADDALLDMLRSGGTGSGGTGSGGTGSGGTGSGETGTESTLTDSQVTDLLVAWRRDIEAEPIPELLDVDTALREVARARGRIRTGPRRFGVPLASAASVLLVAFGGLGVAAQSAQPGDSLWPLTRVLYSDHARSVEAAAAVRDELAKADAALREGRWDEAEESLRRARAQLAVIEPDQGREDLMQRHAELMGQLRSAPLPPEAPAPPPAAASTTDVETPHEAPADPKESRSLVEAPPEKPTPTTSQPPPSSSPSTPTPGPASGQVGGGAIPGNTNSWPGTLPSSSRWPAQPMSQPTDDVSSEGSATAAPPPEMYIVEAELT